MKKSKIETVDTRKRILAAATRLFLANGLAETGIASITSAAGLTPGGFYRHFRSKEQLIVEANIAAYEKMFRFFSDAVSGKSGAEALTLAVALYLDQLRGRGCEAPCPLPSLGSELRRADLPARNAAMAGHQRLVQFFARLSEQAGAAEPLKLADAIVSTMVGAVMLARLAASADAASSILDNARQAILSMLSAPAA